MRRYLKSQLGVVLNLQQQKLGLSSTSPELLQVYSSMLDDDDNALSPTESQYDSSSDGIRGAGRSRKSSTPGGSQKLPDEQQMLHAEYSSRIIITADQGGFLKVYFRMI